MSALIYSCCLFLGLTVPLALFQELQAKRRLYEFLSDKKSAAESISLNPNSAALSWITLFMLYRTGLILSLPRPLRHNIKLVIIGRFFSLILVSAVFVLLRT